MIDLTRTASDGVRDLKAFIEFADRGPRALAEANKGSLGGADSPFEEAVSAELRRRGWTVVPQVGVSKFRIDMGIVHPDRPGDYLVGVECDGASYHSAATARDRDKVRQSILEGLGWKLVRIWSTDWWIDRQRAADKLHARIEAALSEDRTARSDKAAAEAADDDKTATDADHDSRGAALKPEPPVEFVAANADHAPLTAGYGQAGTPTVVIDAVIKSKGAMYAGNVERSEGGSERPVGDHLYHAADFSPFEAEIAPGLFYERAYDDVLGRLVRHVLQTEAPIAEDLLVQRIARAHGFQRAGRIIRERVMEITSRQQFVEEETGGGRFVWMRTEDREGWDLARAPASMDDLRPIEHIALREIAVALRGRDVLEVARLFGVRRISTSARKRIEQA
jgi:very-short-patch-repair endonuclease